MTLGSDIKWHLQSLSRHTRSCANTWQIATRLVLTTTLWGRYYYSYFTEEEQAQRHGVNLTSHTNGKSRVQTQVLSISKCSLSGILNHPHKTREEFWAGKWWDHRCFRAITDASMKEGKDGWRARGQVKSRRCQVQRRGEERRLHEGGSCGNGEDTRVDMFIYLLINRCENGG